MQNKPFTRIDNRLVEQSADNYSNLKELDETEKLFATSYPINPADLDKFEFGKQYLEGKDFEVKKYYSCSLNNVCDCDNGQLCPQPNKEPFATEVLKIGEKEKYAGSMLQRVDYLEERVSYLEKLLNAEPK